MGRKIEMLCISYVLSTTYNGVKGTGPLAGGSEGGRSRPLLVPFLTIRGGNFSYGCNTYIK